LDGTKKKPNKQVNAFS